MWGLIGREHKEVRKMGRGKEVCFVFVVRLNFGGLWLLVLRVYSCSMIRVDSWQLGE